MIRFKAKKSKSIIYESISKCRTTFLGSKETDNFDKFKETCQVIATNCYKTYLNIAKE